MFVLKNLAYNIEKSLVCNTSWEEVSMVCCGRCWCLDYQHQVISRADVSQSR